MLDCAEASSSARSSARSRAARSSAPTTPSATTTSGSSTSTSSLQRRRRAEGLLLAGDDHAWRAAGADVLRLTMPEYTPEASAATTPSRARRPYWEELHDRARRPPLGARRRSCRPATARTARSASAAHVARRSAAPAACASTASPASPATPTSTRRRRQRLAATAPIDGRADGQHARDQGPDRRHGRRALEEGPARHAVADPRGRAARARVHRRPPSR